MGSPFLIFASPIKIRVGFCILLLLFLISFTIYVCAPKPYNYDYNLFCGVYYLGSVIIYYKLYPRRNFLDFDFLFLVAYFFVMFFYPIFIHPVGTSYFAFLYEFRSDLINKSTGLSLMGICAYFVGRSIKFRKVQRQPILKNKIIPTDLLFCITVCSFVGFICCGGYQNLFNLYAGNDQSDGIGNYFLLLTTCGIMCEIIIWMRNLYVKSINPLLRYSLPHYEIVFVGLVCCLILITGSRTIPMQIMLIVLGLYSYLFRPLSFKKVTILTMIGFIGMFGVVMLRSRGGISFTSVSDLAMDLIVNNRNSFVSLEYVEKNGLTFGRSMLGLIASPVPFLQNLLTNSFGLDPRSLTSSLIITKETLGAEGNLGMGTNIIADIYMAYGSLGVMLCMYTLGWFVTYLMSNAKSSIYALTGYGIMLSYAVFQVRAEYLFSLRLLVWCLVIINIVMLHPVSLKLKSKG